MVKSVLFSLTLVVAGSAAVTSEAATKAEQVACRSDAMKYCSSHIGKPSEMNSCLVANKSNLSEACRKVIEAHGG
jgi:hypothetical protein